MGTRFIHGVFLPVWDEPYSFIAEENIEIFSVENNSIIVKQYGGKEKFEVNYKFDFAEQPNHWRPWYYKTPPKELYSLLHKLIISAYKGHNTKIKAKTYLEAYGLANRHYSKYCIDFGMIFCPKTKRKSLSKYFPETMYEKNYNYDFERRIVFVEGMDDNDIMFVSENFGAVTFSDDFSKFNAVACKTAHNTIVYTVDDNSLPIL